MPSPLLFSLIWSTAVRFPIAHYPIGLSAWQPRAAIYLGDDWPSLESIDHDSCRPCKTLHNVNGSSSSSSPNELCCPPALLSLGCPHCGTTAVASWLLEMPNITHSTKGKEPKYLFNLEIPQTHGAEPLRNYLRLWPNTGRASGRYGVDMSPDTGGRCASNGIYDQRVLEHQSSGITASTIAQLTRRIMPSIKLLVIVRHPAEYAYSISKCTSAPAFNAAVIRHVQTQHQLPGLYCSHSMVEQWTRRFPIRNFLFFLSERMRVKPEDHLLDLLDFLGLGAAANSWSKRANLTEIIQTAGSHRSNHAQQMYPHTRRYFEAALCTCHERMLRLLRLPPRFNCSMAPEKTKYVGNVSVGPIMGFHCGRRMECSNTENACAGKHGENIHGYGVCEHGPGLV